ncbi:integral membrane protein TerC [Klebsiella michiganensis]|uniref:Integral membrane protein TerC n=1 Tax=Klebsiella michiganensis TaxID=1134687 RepID=A0A7H4M6U6_9ENTR|nr:integral membrane protein TerC [Klebsiella michiganensis]
MRLALLASIAWVVKLTNPLFTVLGQEISFRDLILLLGGLFLIWKASKEIHESIEGEEEGLKTTSIHLWAPSCRLCCWILFSASIR